MARRARQHWLSIDSAFCDTSEKDKPLTALFPCMQLEALCAADKGFNLFLNYACFAELPTILETMPAK